MTKLLVIILGLTVLIVAGLLGLMLSLANGYGWAAVAFGSGAITFSLLLITLLLQHRQKGRN